LREPVLHTGKISKLKSVLLKGCEIHVGYLCRMMVWYSLQQLKSLVQEGKNVTKSMTVAMVNLPTN